MTNQTGVKEQVEQVVAEKILGKLAKLGAVEERALKHSVAAVQIRHDGNGVIFAQVHTTTKNIPGSVVAEVLTKLGKLGLVRKISVDGKAFIAHSDATREGELLAAVKRSVGESRYSAYAATKPGRRQRYQDEETSFVVASTMPLTDPEEIHYSEREGAMTYEGSVAEDPFEAEVPSDTVQAQELRQAQPARSVPGYELERGFDPYGDDSAAHFGRPTIYGTLKPIGPLAQRRIDYQLQRLGMAERNAAKAHARYLKTDPVMQQWFAHKEMEENARREERKAFQTAESHDTAIAPAMSPEQAYTDNQHT